MIATQQKAYPELITITQAAAVLGRTRGAIHHHRLTGKLPSIRVGRMYLISKESVEALRRERVAH